MKHLKSFQLFESSYTPEEFVNELIRHFSKYNMSSVEVRELINRLDIDTEIESGKTPLQFSIELVKELGLEDRGKDGYMSHYIPKNWESEIKYL